ncbi:phosphatase 2C-like domain-containing protein [Corynascus novoguineensis]|uniref:Protein phosphatase n=1 Tax=Corynascus novoguineensis TaxID=1126955 RepID=A0AAN7D5I7_9PEZI|nr:phosphatase 2C-like domain-containing protein [Corynascus novoguineensis]
MARAATTARVLLLPCRPSLSPASDVRARTIVAHRAAIGTVCFSSSAADKPLRTIPLSRTVGAVPIFGRQRSSLPRLLNRPTRMYSQYSTSAPSSPSNKFVYNVAASYIAKGRSFDPSTHVFQFNPYNRVQPPKAGRGKSSRPESGQDAFFVSRLGANPGEVTLGVADGVGGWMDSGVDPADFSHAFCDYMAAAAVAATATTGGTGKPLTARQLMQKGYEAVCHDPAIKAGGSTAIVGLLTAEGVLEVANLGDSGFILLRLNGVHAFSEPQTHAFNTPYQLSVVPPSMLLRAAAFGGAQLMDQPRDAEVTRLRLRHGDVLVLASDGLWDNLYNQDVLRIVSRTMARVGAWTLSTERGVQVAPDLRQYTALGETNTPASSHPTLQSLLATEIVGAAKAASVNSKLDGPFAKEVKKYYPHEVWHGGKEDDICAVVVLVSEEEATTAAPKAKL